MADTPTRKVTFANSPKYLYTTDVFEWPSDDILLAEVPLVKQRNGADEMEFSVENLKRASAIEMKVELKQLKLETKVSFKEQRGRELEEACATALRLVPLIHDPVTRVLQKQFVKKVFWDVPEHRYKQLEQSGKKWAEQAKDFILKCQVIKADFKLPARDENALSNPYCLLGIVPRQQAEKKEGQHHLAVWKKKNAAEKIYRTETMQKTINPVWNETFEMKISNPSTATLVVEVWDNDENVEKSGGFGSLRAFYEFVGKSDAFVGCASHFIMDDCTNIGERKLDLLTHSPRNLTVGTITLQLTLHVDMKELTKDFRIPEHYKLTHAVVAYESVEDGEQVKRWRGQLSETATFLMNIHTNLYNLSTLQHTAILLTVMMDYHQAHGVQISCFQKLVHTIAEHEDELAPYTAENITVVTSWVDNLLSGLKVIWTWVVNFLSNHLLLINFKHHHTLDRLEAFQLTLSDLHQIRSFKSRHLNVDNSDYKTVLTSCIEASALCAFAVRSEKIRALVDYYVVRRIKAFCRLCHYILESCNSVLKTLQPSFLEDGIDYFSIYFRIIGNQLYTETRKHLASCSRDDAYETYQLYHALQKINCLAATYAKNYEQLAISQTHELFKDFVPAWISIAMSRTQKDIQRVIAIDTILEVTEVSTSIVDIDVAFARVISFWRNLSWPDKIQSVEYTVSIVEGLCQLASHYVESFFHKVNKVDTAHKNGRYLASQELCISLKNFENVKEIVDGLPLRMKLNAYMQWLKKPDDSMSSEESELEAHAQHLLDKTLHDANEAMTELMVNEVKKIVNKLLPEIKVFLIQIMADTTDKDPVVEPLLDYMQTNMNVFAKARFTIVFKRILEDLYQHVLQALLEELAKIASHKSSIKRQRLWKMVVTMRKFFRSGGYGLSEEQLNTPDLMVLEEKLGLSAASTDEVIERFFAYIIKQQLQSQDTMGTLHFSYLYNETKERLEVDVLYAEKLMSEKIDPYVELILLPEEKFPNVKSIDKSTTKHHQTANPLFHESFLLPATKSAMTDEAVLLLVVYDHHTIRSDEFYGVCAVSCGSIPCGNEMKVEHLPLLEFSDANDKFLKELESRTKVAATKLCKIMKKLIIPEKVRQHS